MNIIILISYFVNYHFKLWSSFEKTLKGSIAKGLDGRKSDQAFRTTNFLFYIRKRRIFRQTAGKNPFRIERWLLWMK